MDPEEEFMMWILPQILAEEEELQNQPAPPPPRQMSETQRTLEMIFLISMACYLLACLVLALEQVISG